MAILVVDVHAEVEETVAPALDPEQGLPVTDFEPPREPCKEAEPQQKAPEEKRHEEAVPEKAPEERAAPAPAQEAPAGVAAGVAEGAPESAPADAQPAPTASAELTTWVYKPENGKPFIIRDSPSIDRPSDRNATLLPPGQVLRICEEMPGQQGIVFLRLADGRGWVFDRLPDKGTMFVKQDPQKGSDLGDDWEAGSYTSNAGAKKKACAVM